MQQGEARKIDSVRKRYLVTLVSNAIALLSRLVTAGVVPRALGPKELGDFGFLSRVGTSFMQLFNLETSSAFFNYNSKYEKTGEAVKLYSLWLAAQLVISVILVFLAAAAGITSWIWPSQELKYIVWIIVFSWVLLLSSTAKQLSDSKGYTSLAQIINLAISLINIAILVIFAVTGMLNLGRYIIIQTLSSAAIAISIIYFIIIPHRDIYWDGFLRGKVRDILKYFYDFCHPLVTLVIVGFAFSYLDRFFLQKFFGSVEQGYFHIASSWAAVATIFTSSILSIYKREMANSLGSSNDTRASEIFSRYLKMMYFLTVIMSVFLAFHAKELLVLIAGKEFEAAWPVVAIMAFYPALQVYGQLGGAAFLASERTVLYRNISIVSKLLGIPLCYFLLAPAGMAIPGLGLGAIGLALKTVLWSLIVTQVYLIYNCRFFKVSASMLWRHQLNCIALLSFIMFLLKMIAGLLLKGDGTFFNVMRLSVEIPIYFIAAGAAVWFFPDLSGIQRHEIISLFTRIRTRGIL